MESEIIKSCIEKINMSYFGGLMSPKWYNEIDVMLNKYKFSIEVIESLFDYCFKKNTLNSI